MLPSLRPSESEEQESIEESGIVRGLPLSVEQIREQIEAARASGREFRRRVHVPMRMAGSGLTTAGVVLGAIFPGRVYGALFALPGFCLLLFTLLPTDNRLIRLTGSTCIVLALLASVLSVVAADASLRELNRLKLDNDLCTVHMRGCVAAGLFFSIAILLFLALLHLATTLSLAVCRLPARALLDLLFKVVGLLYALIGSVMAVATGLHALSLATDRISPLPPRHEFLDGFTSPGKDEGDVARLVAVGACMLEAAALSFALRWPRARIRVHSWLAARGEAAHTAAGIAALFDDRPVREVQERAAASFRYITLDKMSVQDLRPDASAADLYNRSSPAVFGGVDSFVSHSWSDDPEKKWAALCAWADDFKALHGREPRIWFDRACVPQTAISDSIRCLPLYVAGCSTLLLLMGETTLRRLWCVVELHVWLSMGGDMNRIHKVRLSSDNDGDTCVSTGGGGGNGSDAAPASDETPSAVLAAMATERARAVAQLEIDTFDVEMATCSKEADRERLLTMIEAGVGGIVGFNDRLRVALTRLEARRDSHMHRLAGPLQWATVVRRGSGDPNISRSDEGNRSFDRRRSPAGVSPGLTSHLGSRIISPSLTSRFGLSSVGLASVAVSHSQEASVQKKSDSRSKPKAKPTHTGEADDTINELARSYTSANSSDSAPSMGPPNQLEPSEAITATIPQSIRACLASAASCASTGRGTRTCVATPATLQSSTASCTLRAPRRLTLPKTGSVANGASHAQVVPVSTSAAHVGSECVVRVFSAAASPPTPHRSAPQILELTLPSASGTTNSLASSCLALA